MTYLKIKKSILKLRLSLEFSRGKLRECRSRVKYRYIETRLKNDQ